MSGNYIKWNKEVDTLKELIKSGKTNKQIAEYYEKSTSAISSALSRLRKQGLMPDRDTLQRQKHNTSTKQFQNKTKNMKVEIADKKVKEFKWRKFVDSMIDIQRQQREKDISQTEATINIQTNRPFAITFSSDWHLGSKYTDYLSLLSHIDLITKVPRLMVGLLGDHSDNFVSSKIKSGMFSALINPGDQQSVLKGIFEELGKSVLFKIAGNHEGFSYKEAGVDIAKHFYEGASNAPYLREGGGVNINVNDEITYRIYAKHKFKYHSSLNPTNSNKRMHDLESPFDIGVLGHRHTPDIEHTQRWSGAMKKDVVFIITGTYKVDDKWASSNGFGARSVIGSPTVVFFPHKKKMMPFKYVEDAVLFMESMDRIWDGKELDSEYLDEIGGVF